ncbi:MAG: RNA polymerase sigma factor [Spirochaetales bacterium]|nr:RNA polymerase sigma factor [Spirochaetales bacterium]MCF7939122.1 RNA polymerase sigma factor [Spirochaetales bacterium]
MTPEEETSADEQEIKLVQEGDKAAFDRIVKRYTPMLYSLCLRMLGDQNEAEDAAQEIFLKAYRSLSSFDPSRRFYSWIYTIAVNHLRSLHRKRDRRPASPVSYEETTNESVRRDRNQTSPDTAVIRAEGEHLAQQALDRLDPKYREVFVLRVIEEISVHDTARILDIPENTVKTHLRRAREQMLEELKKKEWE